MLTAVLPRVLAHSRTAGIASVHTLAPRAAGGGQPAGAPAPFRATTLRPGAGPGGVIRQAPARRLVDLATYQVLDATPAGQAVRRAFRFQRPADCVAHHETLRDELAQSLEEQGAVQVTPRPVTQRHARLPGLLGRWIPAPRLTCIRHPAAASQLHALCERHGPLHLVLHGLAERRGEDPTYRTHHSAVLMATLNHGGRVLGLLVDGNDRQRNAPVQLLRLLAAARGEPRLLSEWTPAELAESSRFVMAGACPGDPPLPAVHQAAWRIVDLQQALDVADAAWRATAIGPLSDSLLPASHENTVAVDLQASVVRPPLGASDRHKLLALVYASPARVEDLAAPGRLRR